MVDPAKILRVRKLLAGGQLSQRKIALEVGVSRGTVSNVFSGRRPDYGPRVPDSDPNDGPVSRCRECGRLVHMPCQYEIAKTALAEAMKNRSTKSTKREEDDEDCSVDLSRASPEIRQRYEELHWRRVLDAADAAIEQVAWEEPVGESRGAA